MLPELSGFKEPTAADYNRVIDAYNQFLASSATPPLELVKNAGAFQLRTTAKGFSAVVTDVTDLGEGSTPRYRYSVAEVTRDLAEPGLWVELSGGRVLTDIVYEWNDNEIELDIVVWVEPFGELDWRFDTGTGAHQERDAGKCSNCGWLVEEIDNTKSALTLTVPSALGRCSCIDTEQGQGYYGTDTFYLIWDASINGYAATKPFATCCGCANLVWRQNEGAMTGTLSMYNTNSCDTEESYTFEFEAECCQTGQITFVGWGIDNCEGDKAACENIFRVQLACAPVPDTLVCDCIMCICPSATRWMKISSPGFEDCDAYNLTWYVEHQGGCLWEASCNGVTVTLEHVGEDWVVTFSGAEPGNDLGCGTFSFTLDHDFYECCSLNVFARDSESPPFTVDVSPLSVGRGCVDECDTLPEFIFATSLNYGTTVMLTRVGPYTWTHLEEQFCDDATSAQLNLYLDPDTCSWGTNEHASCCGVSASGFYPTSINPFLLVITGEGGIGDCESPDTITFTE